MNILITGGLGNLGSWITDFMVKQGHEVWVLSKNFRKLTTDVKFHLIHADIADAKDLKDKLTDLTIDVVIHMASVNDGFVPDYANLALEVNALGTRQLLEFYKDKKLKHFVYFSTFQVYGRYDGTITEETPLTPKHDYGTTHLFAEYYVKQFFLTHHLPHTILRLTNSYGCPLDIHSSKWYLVLNDLSKTAFEQKKIVLKSNGKAPRDFIWMGDVCEVVSSLLSQQASNDIYNLSGEQTLKMIDVAYFVQQAYQQKYGIQIPVEFNTGDHTAYPEDLFVSSVKLKSLISYSSNIKFVDEAIKIFDFLETHQEK